MAGQAGPYQLNLKIKKELTMNTQATLKNEIKFTRNDDKGAANAAIPTPQLGDLFESDGVLLQAVELETQNYLENGIYTLEIKIPADGYVKQHQHHYAHTSILAKGKVKLIADGVETIVTAPAVLTLEEGVNHEIFAIDESIWYCIHQTLETDINKVEDAITLPVV